MRLSFTFGRNRLCYYLYRIVHVIFIIHRHYLHVLKIFMHIYTLTQGTGDVKKWTERVEKE
jgi:hypothetical protein